MPLGKELGHIVTKHWSVPSNSLHACVSGTTPIIEAWSTVAEDSVQVQLVRAQYLNNDSECGIVELWCLSTFLRFKDGQFTCWYRPVHYDLPSYSDGAPKSQYWWNWRSLPGDVAARRSGRSKLPVWRLRWVSCCEAPLEYHSDCASTVAMS